MRKKLILAREVSWLSFNARVLQEASDPANPIKERIRFLGIHSNNSDEFFRVRVAVLKKMIQAAEKSKKLNLGKNPQKILDSIHTIVLRQQNEFNRIWKEIIQDLKKEKVFFVDDKHLNSEQKEFVENYYDQEISSSIIPLFIDNVPLPSFGDFNIFLGIMMQKKKDDPEQKFAIIEVPTKLHGRFVSLPSAPGEQTFMLVEDLIRFNLPRIFSYLGYTYFEAHMFKITKDAEIDIDNDISTSLIQKIQKGLKNRRKAKPIRFLYEKEMNAQLLEFLVRKLNLTSRDSIIPGGHIRNFRDFMNFPGNIPGTQHPAPFKHPALAKAQRVSEVIMKQDVLLNVPYHSFNAIIDLLREAAMDSEVKSIKITGYRLASDSKVCNALINAARNGKEVHAILEIRAYSDEEANLAWKTRLEDEGVKVYVGIPKMKVHAKICVIERVVKGVSERYGFIGTGNLNEKTALVYTDQFLLTSNKKIMEDIDKVFVGLESPETKWSLLSQCKVLLVSPTKMRKTFICKINREIKNAKAGKEAKIILNMNSLSDEKLIKRLYKAGEVGVELKLIIRGIYCLDMKDKKFIKPFQAISIVDEYLEHGRIILFHNEGKKEIYISSADWMERNLDHRVEVAVPIYDEAIREELLQLLEIKLNDNVKARKLDSELSNEFVEHDGNKAVRSQHAIYQHLRNKAKDK